MKARRRRGLLLLSLALVSGGIAASQVRERERSVEARVGPDVGVVIAARDIPAGSRVPSGAVAVRPVPARFVPPGSFAAPEDVIGARVTVPVSAGSYLTAVLFRGRGTTSGVQGGGLGRGERAVTVDVAATPSAGLAPGARVDVLVSTETAAGGGRTVLALPGVELLRLDPVGGGAGYATGDAGYPTAQSDLEAAASGGATGPAALATLRVPLRQAVYLTEADNFAHEIRILARP